MNSIISKENKTFVIAEAGVNHNGEIELAHKLIDEAVKTGADAVKFQVFNLSEIVHPNCPRPGHELKNVKEDISHFEMLKKLQLNFDDFINLKKHADEKNIIFFASAFNASAADFLVNKLKCNLVKIPSSDMNNYQVLEIIGKSTSNAIISTGMSYWDEIVDSINFLGKFTNKIGVLKCTSNYPASPASINLNGIQKMIDQFPNYEIGFSDHSIGVEASICSIMLGCTILEKHFTLDTNMWGPDHSSSLNPFEFKKYVDSIRKIELLMGKKDWDVQKEEKGQRLTMTKGTYLKRDVKQNQKISLDDVVFLRPSGSISPRDFYKNYLGKKINKDKTNNMELEKKDFD
tara:strand:+ start:15123 stop:16160 length:1038 start_codon:yes stop_codon:yes gene_type:complete